MGIIYIMLVVSLLLALFFLFSFIWANKTGQYDDDVTPGIRILYDDEEINEKSNQE
ncbi:MAG: cbb3-type cytochrome oxidase assembly protein CcoS [Bacteroidota bacterium]